MRLIVVAGSAALALAVVLPSTGGSSVNPSTRASRGYRVQWRFTQVGLPQTRHIVAMTEALTSGSGYLDWPSATAYRNGAAAESAYGMITQEQLFQGAATRRIGLTVEGGRAQHVGATGLQLQLNTRVIRSNPAARAAGCKAASGLVTLGSDIATASGTVDVVELSGLGACGQADEGPDRYAARVGKNSRVQVAIKEPSQWKISGTWQTVQSNTYHATWTFAQTETTVTGSVVIPQAEAATQHFTGTVGKIVKGSLDGDQLDVVVRWPRRTDGTVISGEYTGTVEAGSQPGTGRVEDGEAWNIADPSSKATWTGSGNATCISGCG